MTQADDEPRCRWAGSDSPRLLRTHLRDCEASACEGCQPCGERHCRICRKAHVTVDGRGTDQSCVDCLHEARTDLAAIPERTERLIGEAMARGITSEAAALIGPAADPEGFRRRILHAREGRGCRDLRCPMHTQRKTPHGPACPPAGQNCKHDSCRRIRRDWCATVGAMLTGAIIGKHHPLYVLAEWERAVRHELGHEQPVSIDLDTASAYLDQHLTRLAHDPDFGFEDMAHELRDTRGHLDDVLHDSTRPDTGAPCPACGKGALEHIYGDQLADDGWQCPRKACAQWWTEEEYRSRVEGTYVQVATALTASQITATYRVPEATVRSWAARGKVAKRGKDDQGRLLYDVDDTLAQRDREALIG